MRRLELSAEERKVIDEHGVPPERRPLERAPLSLAISLGLDVVPGDLVELDDGRWATVWNDAVHDKN